MKYLFFDCEFANSFNHIEKICEFGYVLTDEKFNILTKDNILINPNIKRDEWDFYVVKYILTRRVDEYTNKKTFANFYGKIKYLIENSDFVFGHTIDGDVHALLCDCNRYSLKKPIFDFYDIKEFYKAFSGGEKSESVETIMKELGLANDKQAHNACNDAYNTMLELKTILNKLDIPIEDLIKLCPSSKGNSNQINL